MGRPNPLKIRHERIRKKLSGTASRPRLSVHFSGQHIYAQVINDEVGATIASANTTEADFRGDKTSRPNIATAIKVGKLLAERAKGKSVEAVVFDRGGYIYHGKVKALADAAREVGLNF
jgi:large subunit ribosomal protein L18